MKRLFAFLLCIVTIFPLVACGNSEDALVLTTPESTAKTATEEATLPPETVVTVASETMHGGSSYFFSSVGAVVASAVMAMKAATVVAVTMAIHVLLLSMFVTL